MKPKLMAILVIGILAVSMILTLVGAVSQAVSGDAGGPGLDQSSSAASLAKDGAEAGEGSGDISLVRGFKYVCPFH
jgi:hypothetical protein